MKKITAQVLVVAIDLSKQVFHVAGEDARGQVIYEDSCKTRESFAAFLKTLQSDQQVLMETGPGAQAWARELVSRQIDAKVLPAQLVAQHRSVAKNDRNDALAILRAGRDTAIHAVPIKSAERLALQALHRVRSRYVRNRTAVSNEMRGLLLEHGVALAKGESALESGLTRILETSKVPLPRRLRELIADLSAEWEQLGRRIERLTAELTASAHADPVARRLMTVPGIGPISAAAMVCKEPQPERYASARHFAASFGLVPDQHSTGGKTRLGGLSKRGDPYIRSLFIQGAQAVLRQVRQPAESAAENRLQRWLRHHGRKGAAVRLANRNLRIVWRLLREGTDYHAEVQA